MFPRHAPVRRNAFDHVARGAVERPGEPGLVVAEPLRSRAIYTELAVECIGEERVRRHAGDAAAERLIDLRRCRWNWCCTGTLIEGDLPRWRAIPGILHRRVVVERDAVDK